MAGRPFLLLQSRDAGDLMLGHEVECFRRTMGLAPEDLRVVSALDRVPDPEDLRGATGLLMGGSGDHSVLDPLPWIARMVAWARDTLLPSGVPTFGSCFGFQVLVLALGGRMMRDPANRELGTLDLAAAPAAREDPLFQVLPGRFTAQAGHTDRAAGLPPGSTLLASSPRCPVHAFRVRGRPVWATQFHPELDDDSFRARYRRYAEKYPPADLPPGRPLEEAPFWRDLRPSPHASALLRRFAGEAAALASAIAWPRPPPARTVSPPANRRPPDGEDPMTDAAKTEAPKSDLDPAAITARAYALYVKRGMKPGHDMDDWLEAERQLRAEALAPKVEPKPAPPAVKPARKKKGPRKRK